MNLILKFISAIIFFPPCIKPQQNYSGTAIFNCNISSSNSLYKCNNSPCRAFLIFKSKSPFNTLPAIATLTSSDLTLLSQINHVSAPFDVLTQGRELIVPVNCACPRGTRYEAVTTYHIPSNSETYFTIANETYQGLSTCDSLIHANAQHESGLLHGQTIRVPLRCACPTREQAAVGIKFLLTYSVSRGDTVYALSKRFNVSVRSISEANGLTDELSTIYPFTTILIPLQAEPSVSQTVSPDPAKAPFAPKLNVSRRRSNTLVLAVGISTGAFSLLLLLLIVFLFHKGHLRRGRNATPQELINLEIARLDRGLKEFRFFDIKKATGNFASKRRVQHSSVYRGTFKKEVLAVKKNRGEAEYHKEMKILHKINHFNIMKLHGFCQHKQDLYLVYEYMANGSLEEWLRSRGSKPIGATSWKQRISIALDVANGLLYLHSFANPAYAHNDVRSRNVLLDGNLRAKISHFSLAGEANCNASPKVDVFGLGIVLLELITDKYEVYGNDDKETLLSTMVGDIMESQNAEGGLSHFVGPQLAKNGGIEYAVQMVKLSLSCLEQDPKDRPDMVEVVSFLLKMQSNIRINQFLM